MTTLHYIGHSAFYIENKNAGILLDPFISQNPIANFDIKNRQITDILVTHAHTDHLGDAIPISHATQAQITAVFELANYCARRGAKTIGVNMGGKIQYNWGSARFLPAFHSSSTTDGQYAGMPASILLEINGTKIYHAGDTCLNSEMKTTGEIYHPDIALLPIGSTFTMDVEEAIVAAQWLEAKHIIPIHYNSFDLIKADAQSFKIQIEKLGKICTVMEPSDRLEI